MHSHKGQIKAYACCIHCHTSLPWSTCAPNRYSEMVQENPPVESWTKLDNWTCINLSHLNETWPVRCLLPQADQEIPGSMLGGCCHFTYIKQGTLMSLLWPTLLLLHRRKPEIYWGNVCQKHMLTRTLHTIAIWKCQYCFECPNICSQHVFS